MRIAAIFMPLFALFSGAIGFYIRLTELWNVFDPRTGLPVRGALLTYMLIAVSAVFLILILLFSIYISVNRTSPRGFENAFGTDPLTYPFTLSFIGALWLAATVKYFADNISAGSIAMADIYFSVLSALAAVSIAFFAIEMYQDPRRKSVFALSIIPTLFMCFWLVLLYRQNASNPILLSYAYQCLAIISSALGFYFTSGFVYNKPAPGKTIFCYFAAIYFSFVTLADNHVMSVKLIFAALIALNAVYCSKLIRHSFRKPNNM